MNCVFLCIFNHPKFVDMAYLLLDSIYRYGDLGDTEILIYTSSEFKAEIEASRWMSDKIRFATNDSIADIASASAARLDLFDIPAAAGYQKFLYLDTDIIVKGRLDRVFDLVREDLLYVLASGRIDAPSDAFGRSLFGAEIDRYQDKTAFTCGMLAFRNSDTMREFFATVKRDMRDRPGKFHCAEQPYIVYNAFKYSLFDNQTLKLVAANDCYDEDSNLVLHHFPGIAGPGEYGHKLTKMRRFLETLHEKQIYENHLLTGQSDRRTGTALVRPMTRRALQRSAAQGQLRLPAVPAMLEHYVEMCDLTFKNLGVEFTVPELDQLRELLRVNLAEAYTASPRSDIVINYECPMGGLSASYRIEGQWFNVEGEYGNRVPLRPSPLFGSQPDARVWDLTEAAADRGPFRVLDIGAGTGRNSLALARRGHHVDAVEMTPQFAEILRSQTRQENLHIRVVEADAFALSGGDLRTDYDLILLSEVVPGFRTTEQLRRMFELAALRLGPGGQLLFNTFLPCEGYIPDDTARELGQQCYTAIFTHSEIAAAAAGLPLASVANDSVYDYERSHLPADAWPPTPWYQPWALGLDLFDTLPAQSPIELRWLRYRKT